MLLINSVLQWPNFTWKRPGMVLRYKNRQYLRCWFSQYWPNELSVTSNRTKCLFGWWFWRKWNWKIRFRNESINEISLKNWIYTVSWSCGKKLLQLSLNYSLKVKKMIEIRKREQNDISTQHWWRITDQYRFATIHFRHELFVCGLKSRKNIFNLTTLFSGSRTPVPIHLLRK